MRNPRFIPGLLFAGAMLVPGGSRAAISSGLLLTNFVSATYSTASGDTVDSTVPGTSCIAIPASASTWVIATDTPRLCMTGWKRPLIDPNGTPLSPPVRGPGDFLCYEVGFSNCGDMTGFSVVITDVLPANVVKAGPQPGSVWISGGYGTINTPWATSLNGPWYFVSNMGQTAPMYMRWLLGRVGLHKTGYIRYCVTVL